MAAISYSIISQKQAQQEHEYIRATDRAGDRHTSKSYKDCQACKRRFTSMKVKVIKT